MAAEGPKYDVEMKTKVCLFLLLLPIITIGCSRPEEESTTHEQAMQIRDIARYKLYPTQNIWTFIKVDTQTGQLWQVQYIPENTGNLRNALKCFMVISNLILTLKNFTSLKIKNVHGTLLSEPPKEISNCQFGVNN